MISDRDILLPELVWVEGRCYRKTPFFYPTLGEEEIEPMESTKDTAEEAVSFNRPQSTIEEAVNDRFPGMEQDFVEEPSAVVSRGKYWECSLDVPGIYLAHVIGRGGEVKLRLEHVTGSRIEIPRRGEEGPVNIIGTTAASVEMSRNRIISIMRNVRKRQPLSHFLSIPLNSDEIMKAANEFRDKVLWLNAPGVSDSIFMPPGKLHLTLGLLTLVSPEERNRAVAVLQKCVQNYVIPYLKESGVKKLGLKVEGLEIMNDDPGEVDVLYAKVQAIGGGAPEVVEEIGNILRRAMISAGFMSENKMRLKLHATLMNTKYRSELLGEKADGFNRKRITFDARKVLEKHANFTFGQMEVDTVHISQRSSEEYYPSSGSASLKTSGSASLKAAPPKTPPRPATELVLNAGETGGKAKTDANRRRSVPLTTGANKPTISRQQSHYDGGKIDIQRYVGTSLISNRLSNGKGAGRVFVGQGRSGNTTTPRSSTQSSLTATALAPIVAPTVTVEPSCLLSTVTGAPLIAWKHGKIAGTAPTAYLISSTQLMNSRSWTGSNNHQHRACCADGTCLQSMGVGLIAVETEGASGSTSSNHSSSSNTSSPSSSPVSLLGDFETTSGEEEERKRDAPNPSDASTTSLALSNCACTECAQQRPPNEVVGSGSLVFNSPLPPSYCYLSITKNGESGRKKATLTKSLSENYFFPQRTVQDDPFPPRMRVFREKEMEREESRVPLITIAVPPNCHIIRNDPSLKLSTSFESSSTVSSDEDFTPPDSPDSRIELDDASSSIESDLSPLNTAPPPERQWLWHHKERSPAAFSVLCYNVLCDKYATASLYSYCPSWALNWEYRKNSIMKEIRHFDADIVTLQEVETEQFNTLFQPEMENQGYRGIFSPKSRAKTMGEDERKYVDGCALFWKTEKFELEKKQLIEFTQIAISKADGNEHMLNRVMTRDNIALAAVLKIKENMIQYGHGAEALIGTPLVVTTAHIHWDPEFCDVKLVQTMMLVQQLQKLLDDVGERFRVDPKKIPLLICGDLNSLPNSGVFEYMGKGKIIKDHPDFKHFREPKAGVVLQKLAAVKDDSNHYYHDLRLESAYEPSTIPFTNYTLDFKGIIDYIFATPSSLKKLGVLGPLDPAWITANKIIGFPHPHIPSDHIPLLTQYSINLPQSAGGQNQQQHMGLQRSGGSGFFQHHAASAPSLSHHLPSLNHFQHHMGGGWQP